MDHPSYTTGAPGCHAVERIRLRRISLTLGFAEVRLPGVNLCHLRVEERHDGQLTVRPPTQTDKQGRTWPAYTLQPLWREAIEAKIAVLWAQSGGGR